MSKVLFCQKTSLLLCLLWGNPPNSLNSILTSIRTRHAHLSGFCGDWPQPGGGVLRRRWDRALRPQHRADRHCSGDANKRWYGPDVLTFKLWPCSKLEIIWWQVNYKTLNPFVLQAASWLTASPATPLNRFLSLHMRTAPFASLTTKQVMAECVYPVLLFH